MTIEQSKLNTVDLVASYDPPGNITADVLAATESRLGNVKSIAPERARHSVDELANLDIPIGSGARSIKADYVRHYKTMTENGFELIPPKDGWRPTVRDFAANQHYTVVTIAHRQGELKVSFKKAGIHPIPESARGEAVRSIQFPITTNVSGSDVATWAVPGLGLETFEGMQLSDLGFAVKATENERPS